MKCNIKGCGKIEGGFEDGICRPCYSFITTEESIYSQAYRNANPVELTDEEIANTWDDVRKDATLKSSMKDIQDFARAILRKAQEK